jgi:hypothetical protein
LIPAISILTFWTASMPPFFSGVGAVSTTFEPPTVGSGRPLTTTLSLDSYTGWASVPTFCRQAAVASIRPKRTTGWQSSTRNVRLTGEASVLPARSVARTSSVWLPPDRRGVVNCPCGAHASHALVSTSSLRTLSIRHSKVEPASLDSNVNTGVVPVLAPSAGPPAIFVSGASASSVNERCAGVVSSLPPGALARTLST